MSEICWSTIFAFLVYSLGFIRTKNFEYNLVWGFAPFVLKYIISKYNVSPYHCQKFISFVIFLCPNFPVVCVYLHIMYYVCHLVSTFMFHFLQHVHTSDKWHFLSFVLSLSVWYYLVYPCWHWSAQRELRIFSGLRIFSDLRMLYIFKAVCKQYMICLGRVQLKCINQTKCTKCTQLPPLSHALTSVFWQWEHGC